MIQGSAGVAVADAYRLAWQTFDGTNPMPTWFENAAETLQLLRQRIKLPDNYTVFDTETCGFDAGKDLILEVGWTIVVGRQPVDCQGMVLDWTRHPGIDQAWLAGAIERTRASMAEKGRPYHFSMQRLHDEGVDPLEGIYTFIRLLYDALVEQEWLVGHNAWRFDRRMVSGHAWRFLGNYQLPWERSPIFDTGLTEKAIQTNRPPRAEDSLDDWFGRLEGLRVSGVSWNLDNHCWNKYRIGERYGLSQANAHQAGFDCLVTHYLLETYRSLLEALG